MKKGKTKLSKFFLEGSIFVLLLCLGIASAYLLSPATKKSAQEITFDQAISRIKNKEISEINVKTSQLIIVDNNENEFWTSLNSSDAAIDLILKTADESSVKKVSLEPRSDGLFWIIAIQLVVPFTFLAGTIVFLMLIYKNHIRKKG